MSRLTEYHSGVAVIKDKSLLPDAMSRLAAYEDAYKLQIVDHVELLVRITDKMIADYNECQQLAGRIGDGKSCEGCCLDVDVFGQGLCELPVIVEQLN